MGKNRGKTGETAGSEDLRELSVELQKTLELSERLKDGVQGLNNQLDGLLSFMRQQRLGRALSRLPFKKTATPNSEIN